MFFRILSTLIVLVVCGLVVYAGTLPWREEQIVQQATAGKIPLSSDTYLPLSDRIGRRLARIWLALDEGSDQDAEFQIRQSIHNRPLYAPSWLDFAEVKLRQGEPEEAAKYAQTAEKLWPTRRRHLWRLAMFWIRMGDNEEALSLLRSYLVAKPGHVQRVAVVAARLQPDPAQLLESVLPENPSKEQEADYYLLQFLLYAINQKNAALAEEVWSRLQEETIKDTNLLQRYIGFLIAERAPGKAVEVWRRSGGEEPMERMINGGFEQRLAQAGFGWVARDTKGARWKRDQEIAYAGNYSLRIDFDGTENVDFYHLRQQVPVQPAGRYRLTGFWRGANVTTRSNPFVEMYSVGAEKNTSARGEPKRLNWDWTPFELEFSLPADSHFLDVRLRRYKTDALDKLIAGTVWLDELKLEPAPDLIP